MPMSSTIGVFIALLKMRQASRLIDWIVWDSIKIRSQRDDTFLVSYYIIIIIIIIKWFQKDFKAKKLNLCKFFSMLKIL